MPERDGRHRRSDASRDAIVTALLTLVADGHVTPGAEQVASRAGVSNRTVFRHFADMEALYAAMADRLALEYDGWQAPFVATHWRERLDEMVLRRTATFERLLPVKRAADAHRHRSPELQRRHADLLARMRDRLVGLLPVSIVLDRFEPQRIEAIDLWLSLDAWQRLRDEQHLSHDAALAVVRDAIERTIAPRGEG